MTPNEAELFQALIAFKSEHVFNPWRERDAQDVAKTAAAARVERLKAHFIFQPQLLLLGEAPGYQGCHFSGIPFTNEKLLLSGAIPRVSVAQRISTRPRPWSEPSATIVWGTLYELGIAEQTVLWNTFAWHPHKPQNPYSNRTPTEAELHKGLKVLKLVLAYLQPKRVVAVGKVAERTLQQLQIKTDACVRHPAMGGATAFRQGLKACM